MITHNMLGKKTDATKVTLVAFVFFYLTGVLVGYIAPVDSLQVRYVAPISLYTDGIYTVYQWCACGMPVEYIAHTSGVPEGHVNMG